ncbi:MAG: M24 family metallopeptidase, partial [Thermoplasmata archaeon]
RARIASSGNSPILICGENPLFDYFSKDYRADCIEIKDGLIVHIGDKNINSRFTDPDDDACILQPSFYSRKYDRCNISVEDIFQFALEGEVRIISEARKRVEELVISVLSEATRETTELKVSEEIRKKICGEGLKLFYQPVVSFGENTNEIWHRPSEAQVGKVGYVEVACNVAGLASVFSETFLFTEERSLSSAYEGIMKAAQIIRDYFVEGSRTSQISEMMENFRNERLYLTNPLYPFKAHLIPGNDERVHTGDISVFDIWIRDENSFIRKKIMAVAGSYHATIL